MNRNPSYDLIDKTLAGPYGTLSLADYLRRNGRRWTGSDLPPSINKMPKNQCFRNAWELSLSHGFSYCEGYGWDVELGEIPFTHAWNLCPLSGRVIDATWDIGGRAVYLGIQLSPAQLMMVIEVTKRFEVLRGGKRQALDLVDSIRGSMSVLTE